MAGDLKVSFLHRWVWLGPENKGLGLWMRQGDGSGSGARLGEEDGQTGPGSGVAGGRLLRGGQLHHDSGSH